MDKTKQPKASMKTLIRSALKFRFDLYVVKISVYGDVVGHMWDGPAILFGNVSEYSWERNDAMNVRLLRNGNVVFTFAYDV